MKNSIQNIIHISSIGLLIFSLGCSKPLTTQDVQKEIEEAREATAEAKEKTAEAIAAREQLYADYKETEIEKLEDRSSDIDKRIKELKKTSRKSSNKGAEGNIDSAIDSLEDEKLEIDREISRVNSIEEQDWSPSYERLNNSISQIENEITRLEESIQSNR